MKVFTCNQFTGHWPVGAAAVMVALSIEDAVAFLADKLADLGLKQTITPDMLVEVDLKQPAALILVDGEY